MDAAAKFKIDFYEHSSVSVFGLYVRLKPGFFGGVHWRCIDHFQTRDECKKLWEKIKDLPEYLS